jgi:hypothetical protein
MTTLDPTLAAFDRPDHLGGALQQGLPRPMNPKLTWTLLRTFFLGGITGGILPILLLPGRFADFAKAEQLQYWHLAEWLRLQTGDANAVLATDAAKRLIPGAGLRIASILFLLAAIGIAATAIPRNAAAVPTWLALTFPNLQSPQSFAFDSQHRFRRTTDWFSDNENRYLPHDSHRIYPEQYPGQPPDQWDHTYHYGDDNAPDRNWDNRPSAVATAAPRAASVSADLIHAFALAVGGAALCWLIEVNAHIARVRRFVGAFNELSGQYGVGPIRPPGVHLGLRPFWILGAAGLCALGAFWAAPMMLAAAAHRRYIRNTSLRLRSDLARRQREVLLAKRPTIHVPTSQHLMGICPRENCRAPFPPEALFCRRCGTKLGGNAEG